MRTGAFSVLTALIIFALVVLVTAFVCFVERGQRKILVNYAKRQVGRKVYGGQTSHLPLKLNMAGVIPPIFASSIILFPATLVGWFGSSEGFRWLRNIAATLHPGQPIYAILYASAIIFFCFLLHGARLQSEGDGGQPEEKRRFRSRHTPRRPDRALHREDHDAAHAHRIDLRDARVPAARGSLIVWKNVPFYFGGTSLLIIVVVTMDFMAQVQAYVMSHQYESLLKKANFKGGVFPTR